MTFVLITLAYASVAVPTLVAALVYLLVFRRRAGSPPPPGPHGPGPYDARLHWVA